MADGLPPLPPSRYERLQSSQAENGVPQYDRGTPESFKRSMDAVTTDFNRDRRPPAAATKEAPAKNLGAVGQLSPEVIISLLDENGIEGKYRPMFYGVRDVHTFEAVLEQIPALRQKDQLRKQNLSMIIGAEIVVRVFDFSLIIVGFLLWFKQTWKRIVGAAFISALASETLLAITQYGYVWGSTFHFAIAAGLLQAGIVISIIKIAKTEIA